jgi:glycerol-1-phosphate dehydrogenase [NAD(P)+]
VLDENEPGFSSGGKPGSSEGAKALRRIELPTYLRTVEGHAALIETLGEIAVGLDFQRLCVISGPGATNAIGTAIASEIASGDRLLAHDNSDAQVESLGAAPELARVEAVVAVGGGRTIDVAKSVCEQLDLPVVVVPTQLTADGNASPASVIRAHSGAVESRHARLPAAVAVDLEVIASSPLKSTRAGLGDLLANASAVRDWRIAAAAGKETVDDFAALLSEAAADLAWAGDLSSLAGGPVDAALLLRLLHGLVLSGLAMEIAGSSRPCSGSEHLVSHAIDALYPGTAAHGEQVAFGSILSARFQGEDWRTLKDLLLAAGMENAASGIGLTKAQIVDAVRAAPDTRPGRYTVLDEIDAGAVEAAVDEVLGDGHFVHE